MASANLSYLSDPTRRRLISAFGLAFVAATWLPVSKAQESYPDRAVHIIIPGGAGSGPDTLARILANQLSNLWKQPVVVENVVGAGGNIGHARVAKSAQPDGYTLLLGMIGPMAINPTLQEGKLGFDPVNDLQPVSMLVRYPNLLVVHPDIPAQSLEELIRYAKANPGKLRCGTPGTGTTPHLSAAMMSLMADAQVLQVPYKSSAQMTNDLIAGHIDMMFLNPAAVLPHVKAGSLRALAITSKTRQAYAPDVPTMAEAGLPDYELSSWFGLFAPAGTPSQIVSRINADLINVMSRPEVREQLATRGDEAFPGTPEEAAAYLRDEISKWRKVINAADIKTD